MNSNFFKNETIYIYKEKLNDMDTEKKKEFTKEERIIYRILLWLFCILCLLFAYGGYKLSENQVDKIIETTVEATINHVLN